MPDFGMFLFASCAADELGRCIFVLKQCEEVNDHIREGKLHKALKVSLTCLRFRTMTYIF